MEGKRMRARGFGSLGSRSWPVRRILKCKFVLKLRKWTKSSHNKVSNTFSVIMILVIGN